ncbi:unnamed protein product [Haemonchus placei]|uniref:Ovule protein n=1 Tax=Haemonchus placei TaxID=6290 RepID=A0A0N4VT92_HAEPC|nr:unnamed protein product [Haemonchus placei]
MESPDLHRFGDSPRSGSFNQSELYDDLIIDEILSLEDEQRRTSGKTQPVSDFPWFLLLHYLSFRFMFAFLFYLLIPLIH